MLCCFRRKTTQERTHYDTRLYFSGAVLRFSGDLGRLLVRISHRRRNDPPLVSSGGDLAYLAHVQIANRLDAVQNLPGAVTFATAQA
jgi:hypothetical protein